MNEKIKTNEKNSIFQKQIEKLISIGKHRGFVTECP